MAINFLDGISINGLSAQNSEATALTINSSNVVGTRELGSNAFNSTTIPTNNNQLTNGEGYTTNTGTTTASNSQTFTNKAGNISQWTNNSGYLTSLSGAVLTTGAQTIAGAKTFSNQLTINEPTADGGTLRVERKSGNANITPPSSEAFMIIDSNTNFAAINYYVNQDVVLAYGGGNVGIGTTSPISYSGYKTLTVDGASGAVLRLDRTDNTNQFEIATTSSNTYIKNINSKDLWFGTTNAERMRITSAGNVGIGTTSPGEKLEVSGTAKATSVRSTGGGDGGFVLRQWTYSSNYASLATNGMLNQEYCMISDGTNTFVGGGTGGSLYLRGPANDSSPQIEIDGSLCKVDTGDFKVEDGSIAVGTITNSTTNGRIDASNDIVAYSTSDIRLKDNIKSIDKALDKVNSIQGIEFDWIEKEEVHGNSGHDVGVIAQEIEKILPDVVTTRDSGYKAVKYEKIVPLLIEAIKDLSKQVDGLKRLI